MVDVVESVGDILERVTSGGTLTEEQKTQNAKYLKASICSYEDSCNSVEGFEEVPFEQVGGLKKGDFVDGRSGLHSTLLRNKETGEYILVFRGTELSGRDWLTNAAQAIGLVSPQYGGVSGGAIETLSKAIHAQGGTLSVTGHSLGGGLASMVASTGLADSAVVFNAAGLHKNSIEEIGGRMDIANAVTTSFVSKTDVLNLLQDLLHFVMPVSVGTRVYVDDAGTHSIYGFEKEFGITH